MAQRPNAMIGGRQGLLLLVSLLVGCAAMQTQDSLDQARRLRERANLYWNARIKDDLMAAYSAHEPSFRRAVSQQTFAPSMAVIRVLAYEIVGVRTEDNRGFVRVKIQSASPFAPPAKRVESNWQELEERWVLVDGEWYRKFRFPAKDPYPAVNWDDVTVGSPTVTSPPDRGDRP